MEVFVVFVQGVASYDNLISWPTIVAEALGGS